MAALLIQEEIYSSSYAAAAFLEAEKFPKDKKVRLRSLGKQHSMTVCPQHRSRCASAACAPSGVMFLDTSMLVRSPQWLSSVEWALLHCWLLGLGQADIGSAVQHHCILTQRHMRWEPALFDAAPCRTSLLPEPAKLKL